MSCYEHYNILSAGFQVSHKITVFRADHGSQHIGIYRSLLHDLLKSEHTAAIVTPHIGLAAFMRIRMLGVEEFNGMETAAIDIKMDIALLEIGRAGFPYSGIGMQTFYFRPYSLTDALALYANPYKKEIKISMLCTLVTYNDRTADNIIIDHSGIGYCSFGIERTFNIRFGKYLHICLAILGFCSELKGSLHFFFVFCKLISADRSKYYVHGILAFSNHLDENIIWHICQKVKRNILKRIKRNRVIIFKNSDVNTFRSSGGSPVDSRDPKKLVRRIF